MLQLFLLASLWVIAHCDSDDNFVPINVSLNLTMIEDKFSDQLGEITWRLETLLNGTFYIPTNPNLEDLDPRSEWRAAIASSDAWIRKKAVNRLKSLRNRMLRCMNKYERTKKTTILVKANNEGKEELVQINDSWRVNPDEDQKLEDFLTSFMKGVARYGEYVLKGEPLELTKAIFEDILSGNEFGVGPIKKVEDEDRVLLLTSNMLIQDQVNEIGDNIAIYCDIAHDLVEEILNPNVQHLTDGIIGYQDMKDIISEKNKDLNSEKRFVNVDDQDFYKPGVVPIIRVFNKKSNTMAIHALMPTSSHLDEKREENQAFHWGASRQNEQSSNMIHAFLNSIPIEVLELLSPLVTALVAWLCAKRSDRRNNQADEPVIVDRGLILDEIEQR